MRGNSKKRLLVNVVTVLFAMILCFSFTVTTLAVTQVSNVKITASKNNWEQTSNPEVKANGDGYKIDAESIMFSKNISDCEPGEEIVVTVKILSEDGYVFKDVLKKSSFKITNGKYKSHKYQDGNISLEFYYTVRGIAEAPDDVYWDGTTARWSKVNNKVNYTLKLCKENRSKTVAEDISSNKYNLIEYLGLEEYYDEYDVYFKVKAVPKKAYGDYIRESDYVESEEFSDWDDIYDDYDWNRPSDWNENYGCSNGWKFVNGIWYYYENGKAFNNGFKAISGKMHYFFNNGAMATGWQKISDKWYMFDNSGYMQSNTWYNDNGKWYYLQGNGVMKTGWFEDKDGHTYYLSSSGAMVENWQKIDNAWYYFNSGSGAMAREAYIPSADGVFAYHMKSNGKLETGWIYQNGWRYVEHDSGSIHRGWLRVDNCTYYLEPSMGIMLTGWQTIDGVAYYFGPNGVLTS